MRLKTEMGANIETRSDEAAQTMKDRVLPAAFSAKALDRRPLKAMRVDGGPEHNPGA